MKKNSESLAGIFTMPPALIAEMLSSEGLFPGGTSAGLRVLTVYIAYASKRLSPSQKQSLKLARSMLVDRTQRAARVTQQAR